MRSLIALLAVFLATPSMAQTVYKCRLPSGQTSFQQEPCEPGKGDKVDATPQNVVVPFDRLQERVERNRRGGVSEYDLLATLGQPAVINTDVIEGQVQKQYVYRYADGSTKYVYTRDGLVWATQDRPSTVRPKQPCFSKSEIRRAENSASSIRLTPRERAEAERRVHEMRTCMR